MNRSELREHIFRMLFRIEFNSEEEMKEQEDLYFELLGETDEQDKTYILNKYKEFPTAMQGLGYKEVVEFLQNEEFEIIQSKELDNKYKIDLLLKHKDYDSLIGIQCKNLSYLKVKKSIKDNHIAQHKKAIENEICNEVIFLLYDSDFNIFVNYGIPIKERKLVEFIKNKFENGNKKILISLADR